MKENVNVQENAQVKNDTTLRLLRNNRENALEKVNARLLNKELAKVYSKHFAPYREMQIANLFVGASKEEIAKEFAAFNKDTQNATLLLYVLAKDDKVVDNTIFNKDGEVLFENTTFFANLNTTNKDGNVIRTKSVYCCPFVPKTANDNDRVINYWLDNYRKTVEGCLYDVINERRENAFNAANAMLQEIATLKKYGIAIPETFVVNFAETFADAKKYGFSFEDDIKTLFENNTK